MTFDAQESSRTLAVPLELYLFRVAGLEFAYCDGEDDYVFGGRTYLAIPLDRDRITSSGSLDRSALTVRMADDNALCTLLRNYPRSDVMVLTIRQGSRADPDSQFLVAWAGQVLSSSGADGERKLDCQPLSTSLKRTGLRRNWQYGCPHVLYGGQCRASRPAATVNATVTVRQKNTIFLPNGWNARDLTKYIGGLVSWSGEVRTILRSNVNSLVLGGKATMAVGTVVAISLGCNHQRSDCQTIHVPVDEAPYGGGNIRNFGGQPFIPTKNPIGLASNYS